MILSEKGMIGITGLVCLSGLQTIAWYTGHDGAVFALVSAGIGVIIGSYFDLKGMVKERVLKK